MEASRDLLFALARQRFASVHRDRVEDTCRWIDVDWTAVARTAAREGVAPIVGANLATCDRLATNVPVGVSRRFEQALLENAAFKAQRRAEFVPVVADLGRRGYDVLLLKSAALEVAGIYDAPWVTSAHDLDIAIRPRTGAEDSRERQALERVLYDCGIECDTSDHHDVSLNGIVEISIADLWADARPVALDGASGPVVYLPAAADLLLTLCLNACRKRYFRLKALFDIAETASRAADLDWNGLVARAKAWHAEAIAFTALRACDATIGLPAAARRAAAALVGTPRALVLASLVTLLRRSAPDRHWPLVALQYAGFSAAQRWRSARFSAARRASVVPPELRAQALLPGE